jgi:OHCU decarboxylase
MRLAEFNVLPADEAAAALRPCLDVERWAQQILGARPFSDRETLIGFASRAAAPFSDAELEQALSHHPRIGRRAAGAGAEAAFSRNEQSGVDASETTARALAAGNRAYEEKFDRVFLIRAAGRSGEEILAALSERLGNSPERERTIVDQQLCEIAALRLEGVVSA